MLSTHFFNHDCTQIVMTLSTGPPIRIAILTTSQLCFVQCGSTLNWPGSPPACLPAPPPHCAAVAEAAKQAGWFDLLVQFVRTSILNIKDSLTALGVGQSAGVAITLFTLLVKGVTLPLNFQQMESTTKMQVCPGPEAMGRLFFGGQSFPQASGCFGGPFSVFFFSTTSFLLFWDFF